MTERDRDWLRQFRQELSDHEFIYNELEERVVAKALQLETTSHSTQHWACVDDDPLFPKEKIVKENGIGIGRCEGIVQETLETVLGW